MCSTHYKETALFDFGLVLTLGSASHIQVELYELKVVVYYLFSICDSTRVGGDLACNGMITKKESITLIFTSHCCWQWRWSRSQFEKLPIHCVVSSASLVMKILELILTVHSFLFAFEVK